MKKQEMMRSIPSIEKILNWPEIKESLEILDHEHVTEIVRYNVEDFRIRLLAGEKPAADELKKKILHEVQELVSPYFCHAVNALGKTCKNCHDTFRAKY